MASIQDMGDGKYKLYVELGYRGKRRLRLHDLRHTSATLLLSKGIHEKVIQKRLGHSRASFTLDTYSHVLEEMDRSASDAFEGLLKAKSHNSKSDAK